MHVLGEFIQSRMDQLGIARKELPNRSGLTRQHVHSLLKNERLGNMIRQDTVAGLARALQVDEAVIITKAAEALGVPVGRLAPVVMTARDASDEELLSILRDRLARAGEHGGDTASIATRDNDSSSEQSDPGNEYEVEGLPRKSQGRTVRPGTGAAGSIGRRRGTKDADSSDIGGKKQAAPPAV